MAGSVQPFYVTDGTARLLRQLRNHCSPATTIVYIFSADLEAVLCYTFHGSERWDTLFVWNGLVEKKSMGHVMVLICSNMRNLADLWIRKVGLITQEDLWTRIIYN